jgi:hypothetical protein
MSGVSRHRANLRELAECPTEVKEALTLLGKSKRHGKVGLHTTFDGQRDCGHSPGDMHFRSVVDWPPRLNQQSLL